MVNIRMKTANKSSTYHDVLAIKPGSRSSGKEELRTVSVGTSVGHRKASFEVLDAEVFIVELVAIDAASASAIVVVKVYASVSTCQ